MNTALDDVELNARLYPERPALRDLATGRVLTYMQAHRWVGRFARVLVERGLSRGERLAVLSKNRWELPLLHLACARLGAIFVPLNFRLARAEVSALLADSRPACLLADGAFAGDHEGAEDLDDFTTVAGQVTPFIPQRADDSAPSLILYTSGTSGKPKGVLLSERNLLATAQNFTLLGRVTADCAFLCDAPMFHVIGLVVNVRPAFMVGGTILVSEGFTPERTLTRLADRELAITHYFCVPQMASALRMHPAYDPAALSGLVALFCGGAPSPPAQVKAFLDDGILLVDGFGMSETGTVFSMPLDAAVIRARAGACGVSTPRIQTRIVDEQGRSCAPGQPGELLVKGDSVTRGYFGQPALSASAFTADGFMRTGDVAVVDEDGFHRIIDRKKDMFISGGENVYPAEIEAALTGRKDLVECAVVGVPDAKWGEVGRLFVVPFDPATFDADAVLDDLRTRIAGYKVPKQVTVLDALPRNGAGKIDKNRLRNPPAT